MKLHNLLCIIFFLFFSQVIYATQEELLWEFSTLDAALFSHTLHLTAIRKHNLLHFEMCFLNLKFCRKKKTNEIPVIRLQKKKK